MTERQKYLLLKLAETFDQLSEECANDGEFFDYIVDNNDLLPLSLCDLASEWRYAATGKRSYK